MPDVCMGRTMEFNVDGRVADSYNEISEIFLKGRSFVMEKIFNVQNLLFLLIFMFVCYPYWKPYLRGKRIKATVDSYCRVKSAKGDKDEWCFRFMYREQKAGKRLYCNSRKAYDTQVEIMKKYPKGTEVDIIYYDNGGPEKMAVLVSDNDDRNEQILYTVAFFIAFAGVAAAFQMLWIEKWQFKKSI